MWTFRKNLLPLASYLLTYSAMDAARSCQKLVSGKVHGVTIQKTLISILSLFCQSPSYALTVSMSIVAYLNSPLSVLHSDNSGHTHTLTLTFQRPQLDLREFRMEFVGDKVAIVKDFLRLFCT
jgi:hypothetical protein